MTEPRTIVLAGSHGLIGQALLARLRERGDRVVQLVRSPAHGPDEIQWEPNLGRLDADALTGADVVINLAGAPVAQRWTKSHKQQILNSRVRSTGLLAAHISSLPKPPVFLQASAVGLYGHRGDEILTEDSAAGDGFLSDVVTQWEAATRPAVDAGARVVLLRTGIVLSPDGGALSPLLRLMKFGLAGPLGSGKQFWSWITLEDHVSALVHLIDSSTSGAVNLTAPKPVTNSELTSALAHEMHRPAFVRAPAFAIRTALGGFAGEILGSQRVLPTVLESSGFEFQHPDITSAVQWVARQ